MLPIWELIKDKFPFHPNGKFLNLGVEKFWIIEHRLPIWIEHLYKLLLLLYLICSEPSNWCHYCMSLGSLKFTIESGCFSYVRVLFWEEYPRVVIHLLSWVFIPPSIHRRSTTFTSMIHFRYKTCGIIVYRSAC